VKCYGKQQVGAQREPHNFFEFSVGVKTEIIMFCVMTQITWCQGREGHNLKSVTLSFPLYLEYGVVGYHHIVRLQLVVWQIGNSVSQKPTDPSSG